MNEHEIEQIIENLGFNWEDKFDDYESYTNAIKEEL